jgi:hypothetical protein
MLTGHELHPRRLPSLQEKCTRQWIKDLATGHRTFAERQSLMILPRGPGPVRQHMLTK